MQPPYVLKRCSKYVYMYICVYAGPQLSGVKFNFLKFSGVNPYKDYRFLLNIRSQISKSQQCTLNGRMEGLIYLSPVECLQLVLCISMSSSQSIYDGFSVRAFTELFHILSYIHETGV